MQNLLETLIKERRLWKDKWIQIDYITSITYKNGEIIVLYDDECLMSFKTNIWHIDTLREIVKAQHGTQEHEEVPSVTGNGYRCRKCGWRSSEGKFTRCWQYKYNQIVNSESSQERENYLLSQ